MNKKRVLVIGDIMLDIYHYGLINRISPEAPIPVFEETRTEYKAGGAANLALNLKALNLSVSVFTPAIFPSKELEIFAKLMDGNDIEFICGDKHYQNLICKHRFIDQRNNCQVGLRWDNEKLLISGMLDAASKYSLPRVNAVVFSDYCKGALNDEIFVSWIINQVYPETIKLLDSRSKFLSKFKGIEIFKPNMNEFSTYINQPTRFETVFRTESENGMTLFKNEIKQCHVEVPDRNIKDSTGAGDTAMAAIVWSILQGYSYDWTLAFANTLSNKACQYPGTHVINEEDIKYALTYLAGPNLDRVLQK